MADKHCMEVQEVHGGSVSTRRADFYEYNARVQLTTWNPTPSHAKKEPSGPIGIKYKV